MGWLSQKRSKITEGYRTTLHLATIPDVSSFQSTVYQNRPSTLRISTGAFTEEICFLQSTTHTAPTGISPKRIHTESVRFAATEHSPALFTPETIKSQSFAVTTFSCIIHRFSFQKVRREQRPILFEPIAGKSRAPSNIGKVKTPPKPLSLNIASLEERLRWILTPPIHEILSDPQLALPESPYPFQTIGIKWLYDRDTALLADEMGLGKTMQAIIAARLLWREGRISQILVICPKTLISTWQRELTKWWPQVSDNVMVSGSDRRFFLRLATPNVTVKIINYDPLAREDPEELKKPAYSHDLVIIDEAQRIKNRKSDTAKAVKAIGASKRWALTGTPLENKIDDVISIFEFVRPGLLARDDQSYVTQRIHPYMLRRRTEEVMPELPEKSEQDIPIKLDAEHQATYDQLQKDWVLELNNKGDSITVTHVFQLITRLRQICNFEPQTGTSAKLDTLLEDLDEVHESGRKALVFSQFVDEKHGLKRLSAELKNRGFNTLELHGEVPYKRRDGIVTAFASNEDTSALLLNYKVGGVGLNLQAANYVFLFDRWWNPAVEDQAVKRAHRIGQTQKVFVRRFYCENTIEERILRKLAEKRRLFRNIIDEARPEPDSMGLTEEEIFSLFNLTVRPRRKSPSPDSVTIVLDNMDAKQFEILVAQLYERQGYTVHNLGGSHDRGIDVLAEKTSAGATERVVIQCKHQKSSVGRPVLQQLWGVVTSDQTFTRGDLVTSSQFTAEAKQFAQGKRLSLIDRSLLVQFCLQFKVATFADADT
jgi:superfamily II DNA or RNA helicase/HJR/Mrr/RecB family endonuclease